MLGRIFLKQRDPGRHVSGKCVAVFLQPTSQEVATPQTPTPKMLLEHKRHYGLGMDALVTICSWNTNGILVWAWMLAYAPGTRTELLFGHGCSGSRIHSNMNGIVV